MKRETIAGVGAAAWGIGLIGFFFPFLTTSGSIIGSFGLKIDLSGFALLTKLSLGSEETRELLEEAPVNLYLWVALVAGIIGLFAAINCIFYFELAQEGYKPTISVVCGVVGVLFLFMFRLSYPTDDNFWHNDWALLDYGLGRTITLWSWIAATGCMLLASLWKETKETYEKPVSAAPLSPPVSTTSRMEEREIQTKLEMLKKRFISEEITAEEYEREKRLVQEIIDEQSAATITSEKAGIGSAKEGQLLEDGKMARFSGSRYGTRQVACPACGQIQSAERKACWNCGVKFTFDSEE